MQVLGPLTAEEQVTLPAIRPRWMAHAAALVGAVAGVAILLANRAAVDQLDPTVTSWDLPWPPAVFLLELTLAAPWMAISPLLFAVGYGWGTVVLLSVFPLASPFVGWAVGFRQVRMPYRDWRPSARQRLMARPVPGTGYHVLQRDVDHSH